MRQENGVPTIRRPLVALYVILAVFVGFVGLAAILVGPGRAIDWVVTDLLPMVALIGVVFGVFGLLVRGGGKVYDERYERPSTTFREGRRDEIRVTPSRAGADGSGRVVRKTDGILPDAAYRLLLGLFLLAVLSMAGFIWLVVRDQWIGDETLVAGRLDDGESLRVLFALLAAAAVPSGLLARHYRRADTYGSPLGPFFQAAFALCAALAAVTALPALFSG